MTTSHAGDRDNLQLSVFRCELITRERPEVRGRLGQTINHDADQVLLVDVGPADGRGRVSITASGAPYTHPERHSVVARCFLAASLRAWFDL